MSKGAYFSKKKKKRESALCWLIEDRFLYILALKKANLNLLWYNLPRFCTDRGDIETVSHVILLCKYNKCCFTVSVKQTLYLLYSSMRKRCLYVLVMLKQLNVTMPFHFNT